MNIYLMRHAIAVPADEPGVNSDGVRPLSSKGIKRLRRAARGIARLDIPFASLLTSPVLRARQTAEIVAQALGLETKLEEISGLAPESSPELLMVGLARFREEKNLLLVGHEPLLGDTAGFLLTGKNKSAPEIRFRKGGLCRIEIDDIPPAGPGVLHWHLTPKQLRLLASKR